jgi:hypothetical protein
MSSLAAGALAALACLLPSRVADAQEGPLDRYEEVEPEDEGDQRPVHQPAPSAPATRPSPDAYHHHHHGAPPPREPRVVAYDERSSPRTGLVVAGSVLFAVSYLVPLSIVAAAEFPNRTDWMAIPVVGPWMTIGRMRYGDCSNRRTVDPECDDSGERAADTLGAVAAGFTGVLQAAGMAMLITGVSAQKTEVVPVYAISPMPVDNGMGLSVTGTF